MQPERPPVTTAPPETATPSESTQDLAANETETPSEESVEQVASTDAQLAESTRANEEEARRQWLASLPPDEIFKYNREVAGRIGSDADRLARQRVAQMLPAEQRRLAAQAETQRQADNLEKLATDDPYRYVETERAIRAKAANDAAITQATWGEIDASMTEVFYSLPEAVQTKLGGKRYDGTPRQARQAFLSDMLESRAEHEKTTSRETILAEGRKDWEKGDAERMEKARKRWEEVARKDAMSDMNGSEPVPNTDIGVPPSDAMTQTEFDRIRKNPADVKINRKRIDSGLQRGLITH